MAFGAPSTTPNESPMIDIPRARERLKFAAMSRGVRLHNTAVEALVDAVLDETGPMPARSDRTWLSGENVSTVMAEQIHRSIADRDREVQGIVEHFYEMVMRSLKVDGAESIPDEGVDFIGRLSRLPDGSPAVTFSRLLPTPLPFPPGRPRGLGVSAWLGRRGLHLSTEHGVQVERENRTRRLGVLAALRSRRG